MQGQVSAQSVNAPRINRDQEGRSRQKIFIEAKIY
jgi:hypothetical protein